MNFKEKWTKQNNSVKLLLKKLRRHDTVVVAIAVVLAMALCAGLIYFSTPVVTATAREELEQSERENNEKTIECLNKAGIDPMLRAEVLSIEQMLHLSDVIATEENK